MTHPLHIWHICPDGTGWMRVDGTICPFCHTVAHDYYQLKPYLWYVLEEPKPQGMTESQWMYEGLTHDEVIR